MTKANEKLHRLQAKIKKDKKVVTVAGIVKGINLNPSQVNFDEWINRIKPRQFSFPIPPLYAKKELKVNEPYCAKWIEFYTDKNNKPPMLIGATGVGKTHLLYAMAKKIYQDINHKNNLIYQKLIDDKVITNHEYRKPPALIIVSSVQMIHDIRNAISINNSDVIISRYSDADMLFIDDFNAEKNTEWINEQMFLILNNRLIYCRATVISTNLSLTEIAQINGDRIASRLLELCHVIKIEGEDKRV